MGMDILSIFIVANLKLVRIISISYLLWRGFEIHNNTKNFFKIFSEKKEIEIKTDMDQQTTGDLEDNCKISGWCLLILECLAECLGGLGNCNC